MPIYNAALTFIDEMETKRYAGLNKTTFDEQLIKKACVEAQLLSVPKGVWQIYDYNSCTHEIKTEKSFQIEGNSIQKHLADCDKVIILAATIGEEIEHKITNYFKLGEYSFSLLLDAAATTAVEMTADQMEKAMLTIVAPQGYHMKTRFSPGYGDWDIKVQPQMLRLAEAKAIDISLTDSYMLMPRKSITAIIGLTSKTEKAIQRLKADCEQCNKVDCLARKESLFI